VRSRAFGARTSFIDILYILRFYLSCVVRKIGKSAKYREYQLEAQVRCTTSCAKNADVMES